MAGNETWGIIKFFMRKTGKSLFDNLYEEAPVTYSLIGVITGVFLIEIWLTHSLSLRGIRVLAAGIFATNPLLAWSISPFLHNGFSHFLANTLLLFALGVPVERHWSWWKYAGFLIFSGYISIGFGAGNILLFSDKQAAFYGISGSVFALAGFALVHLLQDHSRLKRNELLAVLGGIAALLTVLIDPLTGPYFGPSWINGGHLSGFVVGSLVGWLRSSSCPTSSREDF